MGIFDFFSTDVISKPTYNFLIVAALQEELNEFYKLDSAFKSKKLIEGGAVELSYSCREYNINLITYTPNKMGMPFNAAAIMNIISIHQPFYTIMIGTCASVSSKHKLGDVLIPDRVFSYESGKYEKGIFKPDYVSHSTGDELRKQAEILKSELQAKLNFGVTTDEDFCSGAAVVDDNELGIEIINRCGRKLSGLDMEAFSIACINTVLKGSKELLVIKGISDFARDKGDTEQLGNKEIAKQNSAKYAFELVKHLQSTLFTNRTGITLEGI